MKVAILTLALVAASVSGAASAQSADSGADRNGDAEPRTVTYVDLGRFASLRPAGTPSDATATVSPVTAVQAMERLDPLTNSVSVSLATSAASGDFGSSTDTSIITSAASVRYALGDFRLSASLPWMRVRSNGTVFTGIDGTPIIVAPGTGRRTSKSGLGDLTLGAAYTLAPREGGPEVELSGRVKLSTAADSTNLSTGETDYSAGIQLMQPAGNFVPFVSASYRFFGDPVGWDLKDGVALSAGTSIILEPRSLLVLSYHYAEAASRFIDDSHELFAGASTRLPGVPLRITAFATAGLSNGAAGMSAGLGLSSSF